jgi:putative nucleotidyltransferase with HDIG domain
MIPTREEALSLVHEYTENPNLRRHMYAVEAAMRAYAEKYGEDPELWGVTGLLHDFDYERWPNHDRRSDQEHPTTGVAILRERGVSEDICQAILAHAEYTGVPAKSRMDRALRAVDDLTGFIVACSLVRPTRISDLKPKSVRKKMKDEMSDHILLVIQAMQGIAAELGLEATEGA